ncbi:hypothetical protein BC828DRAFT_383516 [Blastocladiella britannica]|nr:hypothetical protein BC828DRAFT_383516 [Blastocladiella britannica]
MILARLAPRVPSSRIVTYRATSKSLLSTLPTQQQQQGNKSRGRRSGGSSYVLVAVCGLSVLAGVTSELWWYRFSPHRGQPTTYAPMPSSSSAAAPSLTEPTNGGRGVHAEAAPNVPASVGGDLRAAAMFAERMAALTSAASSSAELPLDNGGDQSWTPAEAARWLVRAVPASALPTSSERVLEAAALAVAQASSSHASSEPTTLNAAELTILTRLLATPLSAYDIAFRTVDANSSGTLTATELRGALSAASDVTWGRLVRSVPPPPSMTTNEDDEELVAAPMVSVRADEAWARILLDATLLSPLDKEKCESMAAIDADAPRAPSSAVRPSSSWWSWLWPSSTNKTVPPVAQQHQNEDDTLELTHADFMSLLRRLQSALTDAQYAAQASRADGQMSGLDFAFLLALSWRTPAGARMARTQIESLLGTDDPAVAAAVTGVVSRSDHRAFETLVRQADKFTSAVRVLLAAQHGRVMDGSNVLGPELFVRASRAVGAHLSPTQVAIISSMFDLNGDGQLSLSEFLDMTDAHIKHGILGNGNRGNDVAVVGGAPPRSLTARFNAWWMCMVAGPESVC